MYHKTLEGNSTCLKEKLPLDDIWLLPTNYNVVLQYDGSWINYFYGFYIVELWSYTPLTIDQLLSLYQHSTVIWLAVDTVLYSLIFTNVKRTEYTCAYPRQKIVLQFEPQCLFSKSFDIAKWWEIFIFKKKNGEWVIRLPPSQFLFVLPCCLCQIVK